MKEFWRERNRGWRKEEQRTEREKIGEEAILEEKQGERRGRD